MVNVDQEVLSSNFRCQNTYYVAFGFETLGSNILDKESSREFLRDLGEDLDELRKLERNQVDYVLDGIYQVGMVDSVTPSQVPVDHASLPSVIDSASLPDAMSHSDAISAMDGLMPSGPLNPGMNADNEFDCILNELCDFYDSQPCVSSIVATNTAGEWPAQMAVSSDPVFMEDQADTTVLPFLSLGSENSPANQQLASLDPGNTPHLTSSSMDYASTPESAATLESESGTSPYYMTPPSSVDSPFAVQPINPRRPSSGNSTHAHAVHVWREHYISRQLQCCQFQDKKRKKASPSDDNWVTLSSKKISHIIRAWDYILPHGSLVCISELPEKNASMSIRQILGLPEVWEGIEGAVNYFRVLQSDKDGIAKLGSLARRFAQIFLYLNFEMLSMDGHGTVVNRVLDACHDEPNITQPRESCRDKFSTIHVRRGKWWWRFAACLGFGILLVADDQLIRRLSSDSFKNGHIDAFITCAFRTRPGTVRLFESLGPVAMSLLCGNVPVNIRQELEDKATGLLRQDTINAALEADQRHLALQETWNTWRATETDVLANESKATFLDTLRSSG